MISKRKWLIGHRIVVTSLALLVQAGWFALLVLRLTKSAPWLSAAMSAVAVLLAVFPFNRHESPDYRLPWIILVLVFPLFGGPLYLMLGNKRPGRELRKRTVRARRKFRPYLRKDPKVLKAVAAHGGDRDAGPASYLLRWGDAPVYDGTETVYYASGEAMVAAMTDAARSARHTVFLESFIIGPGKVWDGLLSILAEKAREGVDVRVLYDDIGSVEKLPAGYAAELAALGIRCRVFNPVRLWAPLAMNTRDHRKILVVDGHTAFTGGVNLSDEYVNETHPFGHWKDAGVRLRGEAVWTFTLLFLELWHVAGGRNEAPEENPEAYRPRAHHPGPFPSDGWVQPYGDNPLDDEPTSENVCRELVARARSQILATTPYLAIDGSLREGLILAAKRGVDVRLYLPGIPDKRLVFRITRSNYAPLLRAGVKIFEYTPGFLHSKTFVSDREFASVGSVNLDYRSFNLQYEAAVLMYGCSAVAAVREDILAVQEQCRQVRADDCRTGFLGRLFDDVLRLFAPLV